MNRMVTLLLAGLGGGNVCAAGALFVAGMPAPAVVCLVVGSVLLGAADKRLREWELIIHCLYNRGSGEDAEELYADPDGPLGWMTRR